jgi:hypothetical protein
LEAGVAGIAGNDLIATDRQPGRVVTEWVLVIVGVVVVELARPDAVETEQPVQLA